MEMTFIEWLRYTREEYDKSTRKSSFHIVDCWGGRIVIETLSNVTEEQAYNHPAYLNGGDYMFIEEIKN